MRIGRNMPLAGVGEQVGRATLAGLAELVDVHRDVAQRVVVRRGRWRDDRQVDLECGDPDAGGDAIGGERRTGGRGGRGREWGKGQPG